MPLPDAAQRIAACHPGARVRVELIGGEVIQLPLQPKAVEPLPIDAEIVRQIERDQKLSEALSELAALRQDLNAASARTDATIAQVLVTLSEKQAATVAHIEQLMALITQPVQPVYDANGLLIGARRVPKLVAVA